MPISKEIKMSHIPNHLNETWETLLLFTTFVKKLIIKCVGYKYYEQRSINSFSQVTDSSPFVSNKHYNHV